MDYFLVLASRRLTDPVREKLKQIYGELKQNCKDTRIYTTKWNNSNAKVNAFSHVPLSLGIQPIYHDRCNTLFYLTTKEFIELFKDDLKRLNISADPKTHIIHSLNQVWTELNKQRDLKHVFLATSIETRFTRFLRYLIVTAEIPLTEISIDC